MTAQTTRSGARPWQLVSLMLAIVVAVLAFLLLRPTEDAQVVEAQVEEPEAEVAPEAGGPTATAESAAILACEVMAEVDPAGFEDPSSDEAWAEVTRMGAAGMLAMTAEAMDPAYEELRELIEAPRHVQARTFQMSDEQYTQAVEQAHAACEDVLPAEQE